MRPKMRRMPAEVPFTQWHDSLQQDVHVSSLFRRHGPVIPGHCRQGWKPPGRANPIRCGARVVATFDFGDRSVPTRMVGATDPLLDGVGAGRDQTGIPIRLSISRAGRRRPRPLGLRVKPFDRLLPAQARSAEVGVDGDAQICDDGRVGQVVDQARTPLVETRRRYPGGERTAAGGGPGFCWSGLLPCGYRHANDFRTIPVCCASAMKRGDSGGRSPEQTVVCHGATDAPVGVRGWRQRRTPTELAASRRSRELGQRTETVRTGRDYEIPLRALAMVEIDMLGDADKSR